MIRVCDLWRNCRGGAAIEIALVTPLLLILMMGSIELGNYFYNEHELVTSVRDAARYAARQTFSNYSACSGQVPTAGTAGSVFENTKLMARTGTLDTTSGDLLPRWSDAATSFDATMTCLSSLDDGSGGNYTLGGIYANVSAPTVVVSVSLPYRSLFATAFGFSGLGMTLNASQSAAVTGL